MTETVGDKIDKQTKEYIVLAEKIHANKDRNFWKEAKTLSDVVALVLVDQKQIIFTSENIIKNVEAHFNM